MSSSWSDVTRRRCRRSLTSTSSCPKSATAPPTRAATCSASATSHDLKVARPPPPQDLLDSSLPAVDVRVTRWRRSAARLPCRGRWPARLHGRPRPVRSTTWSFREGISLRLLVLFVNSSCCQQEYLSGSQVAQDGPARGCVPSRAERGNHPSSPCSSSAVTGCAARARPVISRLDAASGSLSYTELDARATQLAAS